MGVLVLRLASVASAGSIHLLCGAGRVPFVSYLAGTAIGLVPAIAALTGLGALVRHTLLAAIDRERTDDRRRGAAHSRRAPRSFEPFC